MRCFVEPGLRGLMAFLAVTWVVSLGWAHDEHDPEFRGVTIYKGSNRLFPDRASGFRRESQRGGVDAIPRSGDGK